MRTPPKKFPTPFLPPSENHPPVAPVAPVPHHRRREDPTNDMFKDFKPLPVARAVSGPHNNINYGRKRLYDRICFALQSQPKASHSNDSRVAAEIETSKNHSEEFDGGIVTSYWFCFFRSYRCLPDPQE